MVCLQSSHHTLAWLLLLLLQLLFASMYYGVALLNGVAVDVYEFDTAGHVAQITLLSCAQFSLARIPPCTRIESVYLQTVHIHSYSWQAHCTIHTSVHCGHIMTVVGKICRRSKICIPRNLTPYMWRLLWCGRYLLSPLLWVRLYAYCTHTYDYPACYSDVTYIMCLPHDSILILFPRHVVWCICSVCWLQ